MTIRIPLARHFWADQKAASWQVAPDFPEAVLAVLRRNYADLTDEQPAIKVLEGGLLLLAYNEATDVYGRESPEITAGWLAGVEPAPGGVASLVDAYVAAVDAAGDALHLDLAIPQGTTKPRSDTAGRSIMGVFVWLMIAVGVATLGWVFWTQMGGRDGTGEATVITAQDPDELVSSESRGSLDSLDAAFCQLWDGRDEGGRSCIASYVDHQCGIQAQRVSYPGWILELPCDASAEPWPPECSTCGTQRQRYSRFYGDSVRGAVAFSDIRRQDQILANIASRWSGQDLCLLERFFINDLEADCGV